MEEGLLPYRKSLGKPEEISEERRLCYVGITRAKNRLCLLCATRRYMHGSCVRNNISRFVEDIPEKFLEFHGSVPARANAHSRANQWSCSSFQKGTQVKHPKWGSGRIVHMEGDGDSRLVTVSFGGMEKCLALKYAKLETF
jgi:DNA helicase-2/ATP-dependent DNA helicase PcrA